MVQARLNHTHFVGADLREANLRGVPWLLLMEISLQEGVNLLDTEWDKEDDEGSAGFLGSGDFSLI